MKKLILILTLALSLTITGFSQESEQSVEKSKFNDMGLRLGFLVNVQPTVGDMSEYMIMNIGAGFTAEIDLPVKLPAGFQLGVPAYIYGNFSILKTDMISTMWNIQPGTGIYLRKKMLDDQLIIQPEIDYGVTMNFLNADSYYSQFISNFYMDQMLQFALNIRYAPKKVADGTVEFSLTPFYMMAPEQESLVSYMGARFGVYISLN